MKTHRRGLSWLPLLALLLLATAGCSGGPGQATATPLPAGSQFFDPVVSATGVVVPKQWAILSSGASGEIDQLNVETGDEVEAGALLATLDSRAALQVEVASAERELVNAEHALETLKENAAMARADARLELANAQDELEDAEYLRRVRQEGNRAKPQTIDAARARLLLAEDALDRAKEEYDKYSGRPSDSEARAVALTKWEAARQSRDSALRSLNWYLGAPTEVEQALLDADVAVAEAKVDEAERRLARLEEGPDERELAEAEARLRAAQAGLEAAQAALSDAEIRAPFAGTVGEVYIQQNEWVTPGSQLFALGNLDDLRVETTDLNEIDAARVHRGDGATVTFDAVPEFEATGRVIRVAPKASAGTGVNYTAFIEVDGIPQEVLWGMTAFVDIEVSE